MWKSTTGRKQARQTQPLKAFDATPNILRTLFWLFTNIKLLLNRLRIIWRIMQIEYIKVLITASEICTILYLIRKPYSNNSKFLTSFPPRIRSSKHLSVSRHRVDFQYCVIFTCSCVKFTFPNKIEAMHKRSLVSVKVKPRSTSRIR